MEVGQDMPFAVDNKSRAHALLWHGPVEKIKGHTGRGDIHDCRQSLLVYGDVVLLFCVISCRSGGLGEFNMRRTSYPGGSQRPAHAVSHIIKNRYEKDGEKNGTKELHFVTYQKSNLGQRFQLRIDVFYLAASRVKRARVVDDEVCAPHLFFIRKLRPGATLHLGAGRRLAHAGAAGQALDFLLRLTGHHNSFVKAAPDACLKNQSRLDRKSTRLNSSLIP